MNADRDRSIPKEIQNPVEPPMDADERRSKLDQITEKIIGCVHQVSNVLGPGFLEKVYENSLAVELGLAGLRVTQQRRIDVRYRDSLVGEFLADLLVEECVIVEIKAVKAFEDIHTAQCVNYLKATSLQVCLLVNFGSPKAIVKRIVHGF